MSPKKNNLRTNVPVNAHLISGPTVSTNKFRELDIVLKWVKDNPRSSFV